MRYLGMVSDGDQNLEGMNLGLCIEIIGWVSKTISDVHIAAISRSGIDASLIEVLTFGFCWFLKHCRNVGWDNNLLFERATQKGD